MRDCPNIRMRDLLPDLLHDRLPADVRMEVRAHVDSCAECRSELELLRRVRAAAVAPRVDASRISAMLPPYRVRPLWRRAMGSPQLRVAAAVVLLIGGAAVFTLIGREPQPDREIARTPVVGTPPVPVAPVVTPPTVGQTAGASGGRGRQQASTVVPPELAVGETLTDLTDAELRALLAELGNFEAVTPPETEVVLPSLGRGGGGA